MAERSRILIVDDEPANRAFLSQILEDLGHDTETAADGYEALAQFKLGYDLVVLDVQMPGMDGYQVARVIREDPEHADLPILIATGLNDQRQRINAVQAGANDFVGKPIDVLELTVRVNSLLERKRAQDAIKRHERDLEETVRKRTTALRAALGESARSQRREYEAHVATIHILAAASEVRDDDTGAHLHRMSRYCELLARAINLLPGEVEAMRIASPLHDVGKIGIRDAILLKPGKFTPEEMEEMKQHTILGERILSATPTESELIRKGRIIAISHHEKWDGSGYPYGISGENIPREGRICAVADVFDALTSRRPYKEPFTIDRAFEILRAGRDSHFDPALVDAFLEHSAEVVEIHQREGQIE